MRSTCLRIRPYAVLHYSGFQPFLDQPKDSGVGDAMLYKLEQPAFVQVVEKAADVAVQNVVHLLVLDRECQCVQRIVLAAPRPEAVREAEKIFLINLIEDDDRGRLDDFVLQASDP